MKLFNMTKKQRLILTIVISISFFITELVVGFMTRSLALVADAVHYLNDIISFIVALIAIIVSERSSSPQALSFGWQRAQLLGSFFNGVFLMALGIGIVFSSIERFIELQHVKNPMLVLIVACVGLGLNIITLTFLHDRHHGHGHDHGGAEDHQHHEHGSHDSEELPTLGESHQNHKHHDVEPPKPSRDLGMLAVVIHVLGDAINNIGVIVTAVAIWKSDSPSRFYADPAISLFIAMMLIITAMPVTKKTGHILLESAPASLVLNDVKHDLEHIPGVKAAHELHVWRLNERKTLASVHVAVADQKISEFLDKAKVIGECLHAYNIHSVTVQPELIHDTPVKTASDTDGHQPVHGITSTLKNRIQAGACQMSCSSSSCERYTCCES